MRNVIFSGECFRFSYHLNVTHGKKSKKNWNRVISLKNLSDIRRIKISVDEHPEMESFIYEWNRELCPLLGKDDGVVIVSESRGHICTNGSKRHQTRTRNRSAQSNDHRRSDQFLNKHMKRTSDDGMALGLFRSLSCLEIEQRLRMVDA